MQDSLVSIVPLLAAIPHLLDKDNEDDEAYSTALQLMLFGMFLYVLSEELGLSVVSWTLVAPFLIFGTLGPTLSHLGPLLMN